MLIKLGIMVETKDTILFLKNLCLCQFNDVYFGCIEYKVLWVKMFRPKIPLFWDNN